MASTSAGTVRGIDHIGITVPDLEAATDFLVEGFGAERMYDLFSAVGDRVLVNGPDGLTDDDLDLGDVEIVDAPASMAFRGHRMLKLGDGATIELIEATADDQRPSSYADFGVSHIGLFTDDMEAAAQRAEKAGGRLYDRFDMFGLESGDRGQAQYVLGPGGLRVELISYGKTAYEDITPLRRTYAGVRPDPS